MPDSLRESYEAAPYESHAILNSHVGSLEAMALLHGLQPPPADRCRVLELGCASGGNIIPMAYQFPDSHFIGVDFAHRQVEDGRREIEALGFANVELEAKSIVDIDDAFGTFDYVICHGVYSWVPADVQDAIFRVCSRNLAPNGVAFISHNAHPGWQLREMLRNMLRFHDDSNLPPMARVARARAFADALGSLASNPPRLHETVLASEAKALREQTDLHVLHEQLSPFNSPDYFAEFARRAGVHGLRFMCESKLWRSGLQVQEWVTDAAGHDASDPIRHEQYVDFAMGRQFRVSLMCHESQPVCSAPRADRLPELYFIPLAVVDSPWAQDGVQAGKVETFRSPEGTTLATNNPTVIAVLRSLIRARPRSVSFAELTALVRDRLSADAVSGFQSVALDGLAGVLPELLLHCATLGLVDVNRHRPRFTHRVSDRPRASVLARRAAAMGLPETPTLHHARFKLAPASRLVLSRLDGSHTRDDLATLLDIPSLDAMLAKFASAALLEA